MPIKTSIIRSLYFYVLAAVGLLMFCFSAADLVNLGLKTWVFTQAEEIYYKCPSEVPRPVVEGETEAALTPEEQQAQCEKELERQSEQLVQRRQASAVRDISFIIVGIPLFWFHFRVVQKERKEDKT